eukprot:Rhum_TRINITY_DN9569_c0_g1::Rhum_TRINITY_DN9569_c0_g1_i1::g.34110::m.34110
MQLAAVVAEVGKDRRRRREGERREGGLPPHTRLGGTGYTKVPVEASSSKSVGYCRLLVVDGPCRSRKQRSFSCQHGMEADDAPRRPPAAASAACCCAVTEAYGTSFLLYGARVYTAVTSAQFADPSVETNSSGRGENDNATRQRCMRKMAENFLPGSVPGGICVTKRPVPSGAVDCMKPSARAAGSCGACTTIDASSLSSSAAVSSTSVYVLSTTSPSSSSSQPAIPASSYSRCWRSSRSVSTASAASCLALPLAPFFAAVPALNLLPPPPPSTNASTGFARPPLPSAVEYTAPRPASARASLAGACRRFFAGGATAAAAAAPCVEVDAAACPYGVTWAAGTSPRPALSASLCAPPPAWLTGTTSAWRTATQACV